MEAHTTASPQVFSPNLVSVKIEVNSRQGENHKAMSGEANSPIYIDRHQWINL